MKRSPYVRGTGDFWIKMSAGLVKAKVEMLTCHLTKGKFHRKGVHTNTPPVLIRMGLTAAKLIGVVQAVYVVVTLLVLSHTLSIGAAELVQRTASW